MKLALAVAVSMLALLAAAGAASADHPGAARSDGRIPGQPDVKRMGDQVQRFDSETRRYLLRRTPGEPPLVMHPDPAAAGGSMGLPTNEDAPWCANSGHRIVPVWAHPPGLGQQDSQTQIRSVVKRMNWKIMQEGSRSSNGARIPQMVVDCNASGQIRVHEVLVVGNDPDSIRIAVEGQLGLPTGANAVKYLVFRDADDYGLVGGVGWGFNGFSANTNYYSKTASDNVDGNRNRITTTTGITWRGFGNWFNHTPIHELFHTLGAVQYPSSEPAPFASPGSHCLDGLDMMCYDDDSIAGYNETRCPANGFYDTPAGVPIDCGYDTFFDTVEESGEWLDRYWNVGGDENPFLSTTQPVVQWRGDGIGVYRASNSWWWLRNTASAGAHNFTVNFGLSPDRAVAGDWNGDGVQSIGIFRPASAAWHLSNSNSSGALNYNVTFGANGDIPVAGDWDGDGDDTMGVFRPSNGWWLLRNSITTGPADHTVNFGVSGDIPVVGDWDGDGDDSIGIYRPGSNSWQLSNSVTAGTVHYATTYGTSGDKAVVGDWDDDGRDTIGVYRGAGFWFLRDSISGGPADYSFNFGLAGDQPVSGDWDGI